MIGVGTLALFALSILFYLVAWIIQPGAEEVVRGRVEIIDSSSNESKFMDSANYVDEYDMR